MPPLSCATFSDLSFAVWQVDEKTKLLKSPKPHIYWVLGILRFNSAVSSFSLTLGFVSFLYLFLSSSSGVRLVNFTFFGMFF